MGPLVCCLNPHTLTHLFEQRLCLLGGHSQLLVLDGQLSLHLVHIRLGLKHLLEASVNADSKLLCAKQAGALLERLNTAWIIADD